MKSPTPGHTVHFHVVPVSAWLLVAAEEDERYQALRSFHGERGDGPAGEFDGPDLTLFIVREFLEGATPPCAEGPTVQQAVERLRQHLAHDLP